MWARGIAILLIATSLASAQSKSSSKAKTVTKAPAKAPAIPTVAGRTLPPPKDESGRDKTLTPFLTRLKDVLKRKDRNALMAMLAPDVETGIHDTRGPAEFASTWELQDPNSGVYALLTQILAMRGVWVEDRFCAPYVGVQFPSDLDPSKHQVVLNPDVKLRETPDANGRVLAILAYNIVEVLERDPWMKIRTETGLTGYVQAAYVYSPAAYRACFAKNAEGTWQLQSLAAGR